MGNILSLHRNGLHNNNTFDEIDNLTYTYEGNQIIKVDDSAQDPIYKDCFDFKDGADEDIEYEYDANGNMTKDLNHGICNIEYNCINLPSRVDFLDGSRVLYTYDAKGTKLRTDYYINPMSAVVPQTTNEQGASSATNLRHTWTDYCGNFIYENDTLKQTLIEGGYISYEYPQNTAVTSISQLAPTYHFYVQDHLGNNRLVVDEGGTIEQINHYYPYGGLMGESKNLSSNQRYKYNGKELDRMHGLDWYDYGARFHDPATGRWFSVDPLAHKYYSISPYVYCANNPVNLIDPDGKKIYIPKKYQKKVLEMINAFSKTQYKVDKNGVLCINGKAKENGKGSAHYSEKINAVISAKGKLTIKLGDKYVAKMGSKSKTFDVVKRGGGLTDKTNKNNVKTIISEKGHTVTMDNGDTAKKSAAEILIHEFVGHAAPRLLGKETGNAIENENIVRVELGLPERIVDKKHHE